ncbi:MAG: hypothetical protein HYU64_09105 [Armatimonadetes bacterium]|nr:hypothetical protein [Armatimonadota bacterium]
MLYRTIRFSESGGTALDYTYRTQGWGAGLGLEPDYTQQLTPYASINFYPTMQTSGIIINGQGYATHSIWDYNVGVVFNFKTGGVNNNWYGDLGWKGQNNTYKNANNTIRTDYSGPTIGIGVRW